MGIFFSEEENWYKKGQAIYFFEYYKKALATYPCSKNFILTKCAQCNIELITSCANQGRNDIRCLFGCREIHRKSESNKRVAEYYKSDEGKKKKKLLNSKRISRNENFDQESPSEPTPPLSDFQSFHYIRFILNIFFNQIIKNEEVSRLINKAKCELRQLSFEEVKQKLIFIESG